MARKGNPAVAQDETEADDGLGDILNRTWDEMPQEQILPVGNWRVKGKNMAYVLPKEEGKNPRVVAFITPVEPMDDVDIEKLRDLGEDYDFTTNQVTWTKWIERPKDWEGVKSLLSKFGVSSEGTLKEQMKAFKGHEAIAYLDQGSFKTRDGETVLENQPKDFAPLAS